MITENMRIIENRELKSSYHLLRLKSDKIAPRVRPGQFVHIRIPTLNESALRRPFSIFRAENNELSILYKQVGQGTAALASLCPDTEINAFGPLGNGFPEPDKDKYPVLISGGYGIAPLYLVATRSPVKGCVMAGAANSENLFFLEDFRRTGWQVFTATEDGSSGTRGFVTEVLSEWLKNNKNITPEFFVCGPDPMLQAVSHIAIKEGVTAWISMDRHMGCGVGACLACVQKIKTDDHASSTTGKQWTWARVCTDGPVFECSKIVWEGKES